MSADGGRVWVILSCSIIYFFVLNDWKPLAIFCESFLDHLYPQSTSLCFFFCLAICGQLMWYACELPWATFYCSLTGIFSFCSFTLPPQPTFIFKKISPCQMKLNYSIFRLSSNTYDPSHIDYIWLFWGQELIVFSSSSVPILLVKADCFDFLKQLQRFWMAEYFTLFYWSQACLWQALCSWCWPSLQMDSTIFHSYQILFLVYSDDCF